MQHPAHPQGQAGLVLLEMEHPITELGALAPGDGPPHRHRVAHVVGQQLEPVIEEVLVEQVGLLDEKVHDRVVAGLAVADAGAQVRVGALSGGVGRGGHRSSAPSMKRK